jgi:peptidoglycan-associated lipoprotein
MGTSKTFAGFIVLLTCILLGACAYTLKIKDGRTAFERKQYAIAIPMLSKAFGAEKTRRANGEIAFLLAESYNKTGQHSNAVDWYKKAFDYGYGYEALKAYAFSLKKMERYAEARDVFKTLGTEIGSPYEFKKDISTCIFAQSWVKEAPESGYRISLSDFNSPQNDFAPVSAPDGRIAFTSDRAMSSGKEKYRWTGQQFMDIFIVEPSGASPQRFDNVLNSEHNEGSPCFNKDGTVMYFVRAVGAYKGDDAYCKIYFTQRLSDQESWSVPVPLPFQKEKINYIHPALSPDGRTLYFACNDPEGWGGFDLYAVAQSNSLDLGWDEPKALSRGINSSGNEFFPSFDADTLYFSSDGHVGMGGMDIFKTYKSEKNAWYPPINLKAPINSGMDDFGLLVTQTSAVKSSGWKTGDLIRSGFFTSNRPNGSGGDDIYRFEQRVPAPKPPKKDTTIVAKPAYKIILEGYVLEKILEDAANPNSKVLGRKPLENATVNADLAGKKQKLSLKEAGFFRLELAENSDYAFLANAEGFLANGAKFSTKGIAKDPNNPIQVFEIEIVLDKMFKNQEITLENIYYDYDRWDIRPDAEPTLNRLAEVLRQNPEIRIQLGSHTDCRGNDGYNETLSQRRAESAVNYLIAKGINPERLSALGYGEGQPSADCACNRCSEVEHQTNRRTTFKIVE